MSPPSGASKSLVGHAGVTLLEPLKVSVMGEFRGHIQSSIGGKCQKVTAVYYIVMFMSTFGRRALLNVRGGNDFFVGDYGEVTMDHSRLETNPSRGKSSGG